MTLAILCPGQGSQHAGMFATLLDADPAKPILRKITELTGLDLGNLADAVASRLLVENRIAQIVVVGQTLALQAVLADLPARGLIVAGYSVGDLAAHALAGSISPNDALILADARGRAMDNAAAKSGVPLGMTGVRGLSASLVEQMVHDAGVEIALINGHDHVVVGGPVAGLDRVEPKTVAIGAHVKRLGVRVASHTSYLSAAAPQLEAVLQRHEWSKSPHRLLSPIDGASVTHRSQAITSLARQIHVRLDWASTMQAMREYGVTATLELGAGRALTKMIEEGLPGVAPRAADDFKTIAGLARWIAQRSPER
jgi:[acyl-carrier-protein] S-malonyltransferase